MFYFDYTPRNTHYGSIRQQIWALLHFPFHLCLVLIMEGLRQLSIWWAFYSGVSFYYNVLAHEKMSEAIPSLKEYFEDLYNESASTTVLKEYPTLIADLDLLGEGEYNESTREKLVDQVTNALFVGLSEFYGVEVPESEIEPEPITSEKAPSETIEFFTGPLKAVGGLYVLVYHYFFVSLGLVFVALAAFTVLVRRKKDIYDWFAVALRGITAVVFFGLSGQYANGIHSDHSTLLLSPWPVPVVCLVLFTVLVLDKLLNAVAYHNMKAKTLHEEAQVVPQEEEESEDMVSEPPTPPRNQRRRK